MAEKHDRMVAQYRKSLARKKYKIEKRSPFVDYRPDISATKRGTKLFVEVEIESTLNSDHTLGQLSIMHDYLRRSKKHRGTLVVPKGVRRLGVLLIHAVFGDGRIEVVGI